MKNDLILAVGTVEIEAAAGDKPAKVSVLAYNGGEMSVPGWGPVVIDVAGLQLSASVPLLADHNNRINGIVGHGTAEVRDGKLTVNGTVSQTTEAARHVRALATEGFPFQASVGVRPGEHSRIKGGESVTVNGRTIQAAGSGFTLIRSGQLQEVSIVALGADNTTSVSVAAKNKGNPMTAETEDRELELARITGQYIADYPTLRDNFEKLEAQAAADDWTTNRLELELLRASRPVGPSNFARQHITTSSGNVLEASLLIRTGHEELAVKTHGEPTVEAARRQRIGNLVDLCAAALRADHRDVPHTHDGIIRAAFSTASLPTVLSNTVGRTMVSAYQEATSNWRVFATIKSAANFLPQTAMRPSALDVLDPIAADGEIKHSDIGEEATYPWKIGTFARMLGVTRQDIINDDLGFIADLAPGLGRSAARSLNDLIWQTVMANAGDFFHASNGNLAEAGSALAVGSLGAAVTAMRNQRDSRGYDIQLAPVALAVPPALELTARTLLNSSELITGSDPAMPSGNPVSGIIQNLLVESRLSNTDRFTGASATAYYLFASPASQAVIVGFLNGRQTPTVEIQQADFNTLGIQIRAYHDFGVALGDPKGAYKATGAGE